ncbi:MAG: flagellar hook-associated protein FlgK [Actinomycetia bacterium]|nr:flagellar hook-associated protein FlgK [Actinomycetes bacterium]
MSGFLGLHMAVSGLLAQRARIETIGHNLTNSATPGYSRQRVELQAIRADVNPGVLTYRTVRGGGVEVLGVERITDGVLDQQVRQETSLDGFLRRRADELGRIENLIPEPSGGGLSEILDDFFNGFDELATAPQDLGVRTGQLDRAEVLASTVRQQADSVSDLRRDQFERSQVVTERINELTANVAQMNQSIVTAAAAGQAPNDLLDQRDAALDELASLVDIQVQHHDNMSVDVNLDGHALVRNTRSRTVAAIEVADATLGALGLARLEVQVQGTTTSAVSVAGGELAGILAVANVDIPEAILELDTFTAALVGQVNALHEGGVALDGSTGLSFFDPTGLTARTLAVSADVAGQPDMIAAADPLAGLLDGSVSLDLAELTDQVGGPTEMYHNFVAGVGSGTASARTQANVQGALLFEAQQLQGSQRGVNIDEEMADLISAQHAYEAAARVFTAVDEMLDTLINRTGRIGR